VEAPAMTGGTVLLPPGTPGAVPTGAGIE